MTSILLEVSWLPLWVSFRAAALATGFALLFGLPSARWVSGLSRRSRWFVDGLFTLPMVLPPTVLGFFLLMIFGRNSPIGLLVEAIGQRVVFSWQATVIAATLVAFPLVYRTCLAAMQQIDQDLFSAARTLGLGEVEIFFRIYLPLSAPGIATGAILGFARALGEFGATLMLAGNIPGRTQTMPMAVFFSAEAGRMDIALFWVLLITVISFSVVFLVNKINDSAGRGQRYATS
ncbi:MAG: molybdate ABC transporter permease subunit [Spirochaetaceae bacterium]|nr:MAG: molybdate ABC transporter permease subunit [Spirochaetaceae bacterium]